LVDKTFKTKWKHHSHWVNDIKILQTYRILISASSDSSIKLWNLSENKEIGQSHHSPFLTLHRHTDYVTALAVSELDQKHVFSGSLDRRIYCWDVEYNKDIMDIDILPLEDGFEHPGKH
jgi:WD40 repeat protein